MEFRVKDQRWFITTPLSDSQAEAILTKPDEGSSQSCASRFVVSSVPSSKDYRVSIRHHESGNVEHIIISYNDEDQSYGIEREGSWFQSVVEVLRNYVASRYYVLEPFVGSLELKDTSSKPLWKLNNSESAQHPIDKQPLPQVKWTDLDIRRIEEAKLERENNSDGARKSYGHEQGCCCGICDSGDYCNTPGGLQCICLCILGIPFCICFICALGYTILKELSEKHSCCCCCCCRKL